MKVGIVGGNSKVGVELALLLRDRGHTVFPVVRNRKGTAFLGYNGFDCRIADPTVPDELALALDGVDTVVVAAYAGIGARDILDYKDAWRTNKAIVRNSVTCSPERADIIYFSSIAAFGNRLFNATFRGRLDHYSMSKRWLERATRKAAARSSKDAYLFRLGHVFGPSQSKTAKFRSAMEGRDELEVRVEPDAPTNVVHTVTISDAIELCTSAEVEPGRYTVVNRPQWTWAELFDHYSMSPVELRFTGVPSGESGLSLRPLLDRLSSVLSAHRMTLLPLQVLLPDSFNKRVVYEFKRRTAHSRLQAGMGERSSRFFSSEFEYESVPGPFLDELPPTRESLPREQVVVDAFRTQDR